MRASVGASLSVLCGAAYAVLVEPEGAGRRPARRRVQAASVGASLSALCGAAYAVLVEPAPDRRPTRRRVQDRVRAAYRSRLRPNPLARGLARCRARLAQLL